MDEKSIQAEYDRLLQFSRMRESDPELIEQLTEWQRGKWRIYLDEVLKRILRSLPGKTVVDFGCKHGLLFPLLFALGVKKVIGVEDLDRFMQSGKELFASDGDKVEFVKSDAGYLPLQPKTADLVIMNEVISHINPTYLPVVYAEVSRILNPGGVLFISDGNNLGHPSYFSDHLIQLYDALENGPDGTRIGDVVVKVCFVNQRMQIIKNRYPDMPAENVQHLAKNTSGLFGDYLNRVIDRFAQTGELICRPYRKGICPMYPDSGQMEERGFHPEGVVFDLMPYGFGCEILDRPSRPPLTGERISLDASRMKPASGYGRHAYEIPIPKQYPEKVSPLLLENDKPLPFPLDNHAEINKKGMGRYSVWIPNGMIYLSSTDNSDPRRNGRKYELYWTSWRDDQFVYPSPNFRILATKNEC